MLAGFPDIVERIQGEPTLRELLRILKHLMACAISYSTEGNNGFNLLHRAIPDSIYNSYLTDPANQTYPGDAPDPGDAPVFAAGVDGAVWAAQQINWEKAARPRRTRRRWTNA